MGLGSRGVSANTRTEFDRAPRQKGETPLSSTPSTTGTKNRVVAVWLFVVFAMVLGMVVLGGVTRLNHAGLSMVEWKPLTGWLPPADQAAWENAFEKYRQHPEYRQIHVGMTVEEFKSIFYLEFGHRFLGRVIGVVFAVPLLVLALMGRLKKGLFGQLSLIFVLGAAQGGLGWYMVMSGLADEPDVSPYRLTAHLALGMVLLGAVLWMAMRLWSGEGPRPPPAAGRAVVRAFAGVVCLLVLTTALSGGFVAGLDAGFIYNTFPLMEGRWIPSGLMDLSPPVVNLFENPVTVQFQHRVLAGISLLAVLLLWLSALGQTTGARRVGHWMLIAVLAQVGLGAATLLLVVPVVVAATHQYRGRDAGYPAPPAQIRTCPLRHPAPPLGWTDGESAVRPRVSDFQPGPMGSGQSRDVSPCGAVLLRPAA